MSNKRLKILVLVADYPDENGNISLMYVHTRNVAYAEFHDVTVLNFKATHAYEYDGIRVITKEDFHKEKTDYDVVLSHASNIRNHYFFLKKNKFKNVIFFFHGHEVLKINEVYPRPYDFVKTNALKDFLQNVYDSYKCRKWRRYFKKNQRFFRFVFVSQWMKNQFERYVMKTDGFKDRTFITYNGISEEFETDEFDFAADKEWDVITIRSFLDKSKYCVDVVCDAAEKNPDLKFCLIGKGEYFTHRKKPDNVYRIDAYLKHDQIEKHLDKARAAFMPTRTDAQGLMACEIASYGMPLITSDIDVCHEIFDGFENVAFIDNDDTSDFGETFDRLTENCKVAVKNPRYYFKNTIKNELNIIESSVLNEL